MKIWRSLTDLMVLPALFREHESTTVLNCCLQLTRVAQAVEEEDFYDLKRLFRFVQVIDHWRLQITFRETFEGTSCSIGENLIFRSIL